MRQTTVDCDLFADPPAINPKGIAVALFLSCGLWAAIIGTYTSIA